MISVAEAKHIVQSHCSKQSTIAMAPEDAVGYALSEDIISQINIPSFRQSSMDGYAIRLEDKTAVLPVQDELPAGTSKQVMLLPQQAIRVFTGGPVPDGADAVVPKEQVILSGNTIQIAEGVPLSGVHIRQPGEEIGKGATALNAGTVLRPMHIGFLASMGINTINVTRKPVVALVITGNELVQPGNELLSGQVYESNSHGLKACLREQHINPAVFYAKDDLAATKHAIESALQKADLVLVTGGVSVGEYDYVAKACAELQIIPRFHGVKQKPGKPLFFGIKGNQLVFGLPGNPASVLSCYYQYVLPAIHTLAGTKPLPVIGAELNALYEKKPVLTFFLKGYYANGKAEVLSAQASFQLSAFTEANCWIELNETVSRFEAGTEVPVHLFE